MSKIDILYYDLKYIDLDRVAEISKILSTAGYEFLFLPKDALSFESCSVEEIRRYKEVLENIIKEKEKKDGEPIQI